MSLSAAALGTLLTPEAATAVPCWFANEGRQGSFASAAAGGGIALTLNENYGLDRIQSWACRFGSYVGTPLLAHTLTLIEFRQSGFPPL